MVMFYASCMRQVVAFFFFGESRALYLFDLASVQMIPIPTSVPMPMISDSHELSYGYSVNQVTRGVAFRSFTLLTLCGSSPFANARPTTSFWSK